MRSGRSALLFLLALLAGWLIKALQLDLTPILGLTDAFLRWLAEQRDGFFVNLLSWLIQILLSWIAQAIAFGALAVLGFRYAKGRWQQPAQAERHETDEDRYLESLIAQVHFDEPSWDKYAPLIASDLGVNPPLVLVNRRLNLDETEQDDEELVLTRGQPVRLEDLPKKYIRGPHNSLVLLGNPGSGKSVAMRKLVLSTARKSLRSRSWRRVLPLMVDMGSYLKVEGGEPEPLLGFLKAYIRERMPCWGDFLADHLEEYLSDGRLLLVLDGLNQMPPMDYYRRLENVRQFIHDHPRGKYILTTRRLDYNSSLGVRHVFVHPLARDQIRSFATRYLEPGEGDRFLLALRDGDRRIGQDCRNALLLKLTVEVFHRDGVLPRTRSELFAKSVRLLLSTALEEIRKKGTCDPADATYFRAITIDQANLAIYQLLGPLAYKVNSARMLGTEIARSWLYEQVPALDERVFLLALRSGLISETPSGSVRFAHHIFQEYFASGELDDHLRAADPVALEHLRDPWWSDTVSLMAGIIEDPERLIQTIVQAPSREARDLWLAARCSASARLDAASSGHRSVFTALTSALQSSNAFVIAWVLRALGELGDDESVRLIAQYLPSADLWIQETALDAISSASGAVARDELARFLADDAPWLRLRSYVKQYVEPDHRLRAATAVGGRLSRVLLFYVLCYLLAPVLVDVGYFSTVRPSHWYNLLVGLLAQGLYLAFVVSFLQWVISDLLHVSRGARVFFASSSGVACAVYCAELLLGHARLSTLLQFAQVGTSIAVLTVLLDTVLALLSFAVGGERRRRRLYHAWAFSIRGGAIAGSGLCALALMAYLLLVRWSVVDTPLLVAMGAGFPWMTRFLFAGYLLTGAGVAFGLVPSGLLSLAMQGRALADVRRIRLIDYVHTDGVRRELRPSDQGWLVALMADEFAPSQVRASAVRAFAQQGPTLDALVNLIALYVDPLTSDSLSAVVQESIQQLDDRWRRDTDQNASLAAEVRERIDLLLLLATSSEPLSDAARAGLESWTGQLPVPYTQKMLEYAVWLRRSGSPLRCSYWVGEGGVNGADLLAVRVDLTECLAAEDYQGMVAALESLFAQYGDAPLEYGPTIYRSSLENNLALVLGLPLYSLAAAVLLPLAGLGGIRSASRGLLWGIYLRVGLILLVVRESPLAAANWYTRAIDLTPRDKLDKDDALVFRNRASCWIKCRQYDRAVADVGQAEALDPGNPVLAERRAQLATYRGDYATALAHVAQKVILSPFGDGFLDLGLALSCLGQYSASLRAYRLVACRLGLPAQARSEALKEFRRFAPEDVQRSVGGEVEAILLPTSRLSSWWTSLRGKSGGGSGRPGAGSKIPAIS